MATWWRGGVCVLALYQMHTVIDGESSGGSDGAASGESHVGYEHVGASLLQMLNDPTHTHHQLYT